MTDKRDTIALRNLYHSASHLPTVGHYKLYFLCSVMLYRMFDSKSQHLR
eukprot:Awhi_evm1s8164